MANFKFAKFKDTPLNRDGETLNPEVALPVLEGDVVGLSEDADGNTIVVPADADSAVAQPAIGVLMEDVYDRSHWSATLHDNGTMGRRLDEAYDKERTQAGDEVTYFTHGIYLEDEDETVDFTPNEPVYLGVGGGVTQTAPSASGELVQYLGVAVNATTFLLDVNHEYETLA
ncbi:putative lambda gpD-like head decoration protein [Haloarcula virus HJTV-2]|uniref:Lambda gpD-like head decoration protein n=1 Tax=Haloarcula virus HJTV-2 TaxID=2877986 RepID=A0AAE8XVY6_9CAUD|nr:putative lambda gpD-like head decoration protein [Haloarcula virus HJTV-2]UBF21498.1 putative lambda gpD-like head decoration protein [Halorubrum virus HRTV-24]UBF21632.1 putative lambda gpD-like head decoration protein [Haloarcula virus HJTV-2]UBF21772.1 putative lambda gpD-like head decoration protein [Halorubrum virus HSTV-3]UBF21901.1 putative lambda gpD-like head decoration protein [Haloarcula virus HJTV-3]